MTTFNRIDVDRLYRDIEHAATVAVPLFTLYGWTYGDGRVPTVNDLRDIITGLAEHAFEAFYRSEEEYRSAEVGSGRFSVKVHEFEDEIQVRIVLDLEEHSWYKA